MALAPLAPLLVAVVWIGQGRPILYLSERMRTPEQGFALVKLRTMAPAPDGVDGGVSGADKAARITPLGRHLRRLRLDEVPQLWNILRGDMSFVGPRPPLREFVERFPDLYARVLACRPGITGLATLVYHAHEERLLSRSGSAAGDGCDLRARLRAAKGAARPDLLVPPLGLFRRGAPGPHDRAGLVPEARDPRSP